MSLTWKLRRLSAMSSRELAYRVRQQTQASLEKLGMRRPDPVWLDDPQPGKPWVTALPLAFDAARYRAAADRILAGKFAVFALHAAPLGFPPRWNRDPKTGRDAPLVHGKSLDYRDPQQVGDIKYLWEPSRHRQLVTLAQAWHLSRESKYADGCKRLLQSWFEQCPHPLGPHWTSSLELAVRLINWSFAWHLLGGERSTLFQTAAGETFRVQWLTSIYQHCHFIAGHLSRHSSANNHLLGELAGLYIASVTWPLWEASADWKQRAFTEFESEALLQNATDGVNREQANWYHHEVADLMLLVGLVAKADGTHLSKEYWHRLRAMLEYVASIMDAAGNVPNFGDADDAVLAPLDPDGDGQVYRSLLATGAVLFASPELKFKAGELDDKTCWLLGDAAAQAFSRIEGPALREPIRRSFEHGGYYILGDRFETREEVRIVADAGPLGYLSIAAHGHADALSFTMSAGGRELLIDPGTFAYHTQKTWRDYFRGTSAHNTIRIDRQDQSLGAGNFLWLEHAASRVISFDAAAGEQHLRAEHDGYRRLRDPVLHRRELRFLPEHAMLLVTDELVCSDAHEVELFWHFAESCDVELSDDTILARNAHACLTLSLPSEMRWALHRGQESPPAGWVSRAFDTRVPAVTAAGTIAIRGTARFVTQLRLAFREEAAERSARPGEVRADLAGLT